MVAQCYLLTQHWVDLRVWPRNANKLTNKQPEETMTELTAEVGHAYGACVVSVKVTTLPLNVLPVSEHLVFQAPFCRLCVDHGGRAARTGTGVWARHLSSWAREIHLQCTAARFSVITTTR